MVDVSSGIDPSPVMLIDHLAMMILVELEYFLLLQ